MLLGRLQSASDQIDLLLRCRDAPLGFLLESVEDIYGSLELDRIHRAVRVPIEHAGNEFAPPSTAPSATSCALRRVPGIFPDERNVIDEGSDWGYPIDEGQKGGLQSAHTAETGTRARTRGADACLRWVEYRDQGEFGR